MSISLFVVFAVAFIAACIWAFRWHRRPRPIYPFTITLIKPVAVLNEIGCINIARAFVERQIGRPFEHQQERIHDRQKAWFSDELQVFKCLLINPQLAVIGYDYTRRMEKFLQNEVLEGWTEVLRIELDGATASILQVGSAHLEAFKDAAYYCQRGDPTRCQKIHRDFIWTDDGAQETIRFVAKIRLYGVYPDWSTYPVDSATVANVTTTIRKISAPKSVAA